MTTTIATLEAQLRDLEAEHTSALLANDIGAATSLNSRIESLSTLLTAPERKAAAQRDLQALRDQADQAQAVVTDAAQVMAELQARHAEAVAQISEDRELTAKAILAATKEGRSIRAETPDRSAALALEAAMALAEAEHAAATAAMAAVQAQVAAAEQELQRATEGCAALVFELAKRDFAQAAKVALNALTNYGLEYLMDDTRDAIYALEA